MDIICSRDRSRSVSASFLQDVVMPDLQKNVRFTSINEVSTLSSGACCRAVIKINHLYLPFTCHDNKRDKATCTGCAGGYLFVISNLIQVYIKTDCSLTSSSIRFIAPGSTSSTAVAASSNAFA